MQSQGLQGWKQDIIRHLREVYGKHCAAFGALHGFFGTSPGRSGGSSTASYVSVGMGVHPLKDGAKRLANPENARYNIS